MSFSDAASDIRFLLDRGYPQSGAVKFVCDHYRLNEGSRHLLSRAVLSKVVSGKRRSKFLSCDEIKGNNILIDGYNIIIGMESVLEKKSFICDDGVIRDIKGIFRNFRPSENTEKAIGLILQFLKELRPACICFLFDSQISNSGMFAKSLREKICYYDLIGGAKTSKHVDHDLKRSRDIVASSDGMIIDAAEKITNFLNCIVTRFPYLSKGVSGLDQGEII